ncbi:ABC-type cobalt transport system, CbiQ permease component [Pyrococcus sp. NA2]|uniref:energy-coupling factor transporter transmembrane component T family protein n=1 Tax=Pyrococcus sp. (strain NA2) TaxID=342949 RepID=UPI000209AFA4|nr:energy-coupling factor transporter transmembrane component T [Pyrococcus sp. NA2]AEC52392.1 ABC-type cobalt transport system, CbiQ permease component [Pyrococcus sp. NA2]
MYLFFLIIYSIGVVTRKKLSELIYFALLFFILLILFRPKMKTLKKLGFIASFEGMMFILALFSPGTQILNTPITYEGVYRFSMLLGKALLSAGAMVVIIDRVGFLKIVNEMKRVKVPRILLLTVIFTYRYLELIIEEAQRVKMALDSRGFNLRKLEYYRMLASIIAEILTRAYFRSERVYLAMLSRGFGNFPDIEMESQTVSIIILTALALGGLFI